MISAKYESGFRMLGLTSASSNFKSPLCIIRWVKGNLDELDGIIGKEVANSCQVVLLHSNPAAC